ncbi:MAG TPA: Ig-like domain-containing protein [Actinomycetes bacterium]|nr:Ig-like domain-containing protein [Actinomycetes bacterium]
MGSAGTVQAVPRRRHAAARIALAVLVPVLLAACTSANGTTGADGHVAGSRTSASPSQKPVSKVTLSVTPAPDTHGVQPTAQVVVRADNGRVQTVVLRSMTGQTVPGSVGADGAWRSQAGLLPYATTFTVTARGVDSDGVGRSVSTSFTTVKPGHRLVTSVSPIGGTVVGVGIPIIVRLSAPVSDRAAVERRLVVTASRPVVGAWSWVSDSEVHWRPKTYWPADTDVKLSIDLDGVHAGKDTWGDEKRVVAFHIGSAMVSTVDVARHTLTVTRDGQVLRVIPVTTGKAGFITRDGIKVILDKEPSRVMDASSINIPKNSPNYYRLTVYWAMRVTWSGEFLHAAPWSQAEQGFANVSHGCTGMSLANAKWLYGISKVGDVVRFINSPRHLEPGNGWTDWNVPWSTWLKGDALRTA